MSLIPDELKTQYFPCPECGETLSTNVDICRFCSREITVEMREEATDREKEKTRISNLKNHKNMMAIGAVFFVAGLFLVLLPFLENYLQFPNVNFSCFAPFAVIGGIVVFAKGYAGWRNERQNHN